MNMHEKFAASELVSSARLRPQLSAWRGLCQRLATWVKDCADRYAAAAAYESCRGSQTPNCGIAA